MAAASPEGKSIPEIAHELWELAVAYFKQETIDPLKSLGRFLGRGVAGAALVALGLLFGALAVLRGLQSETGAHLTGSWDFVPYVAPIAFAAIWILLAVLAIKKPFRAPELGARIFSLLRRARLAIATTS